MSMKTHTKTLHLAVKSAGTADEAQLAQINAFTLRPFTADELMVRTFVLAHNCIDRDNEVFDEPLLADFARTITGKGVYIKHPQSWDGDSGPGEGRVFAAHVEKVSLEKARQILREPDLQLPPDRNQAQLLYVDAFFARTDENKALLIKMDAGIVGDVSVGFSASGREDITDAEGRELTSMRWSAPGEALEMSLVWLGAQPGARAVKNAQRNTPDEDESMFTEKQFNDLKADNETLKAAAAKHEKSHGIVEALRKAFGDAAEELLAAPEKLAGLVEQGKAYMSGLVDDIVTMERHLQITGDSDEDVKAAKSLYAGMPASKLEAIKVRLEKQAPNGTSVTATDDPNARKVGEKGAPSADPDAPTPASENAALVG